MAHPDGELATSRVAARKGITMAISSFANYSISDIRKSGLGVKTENFEPVKHAIQMYTMKDRAFQERIIREAEAQGCTAIFLTADSPVLGVRYNEVRNDFRTPEGLGFPIIGFPTERIRAMRHEEGFTSFNDDEHEWVSAQKPSPKILREKITDH